jgi:hypothetical protein
MTQHEIAELAKSVASGLARNEAFITFIIEKRGSSAIGHEIAEKTKDAVSEIAW